MAQTETLTPELTEVTIGCINSGRLSAMQDSTRKKVGRVMAYTAGGVLIFLGILGSVVESSHGRPSSTNSEGYVDFVGIMLSGVLTCVAARHSRRLSAMPDPTNKKVGRMMAYVAGWLLIFLGMMGLAFESSRGRPSSTNFAGYVDFVAIMVSGVLTCVAARLHYGGGLWSFCGLVLVAAAVGHLGSALQVSIRGGHLLHPDRFLWRMAALWGAGFYCLAWGHLRCRRPRASCFHGTA